jgi:hypothetical protein
MILSQVQQLASAINQFRTEYGFHPMGSNAEIIKALRGDNPRKIVFFEAPSQSYNEQGEVIDPWGAPLLFDIRDGQEPRIRSIGPDGKDNAGAPDSDDITSRQVK